MLNDKELKVYKAIHKYITNNKYSPTIRELCEILNYKSTKTVYNYLKKLKEKNLIYIQNNKKRTITINQEYKYQFTIINTNSNLSIQINNKHIIYQIKNNNLIKYFIKKNDYLIINIEKKIKSNELGLFIINKTYRIMKYNYVDGFYILEDNEKIILNKINLIGVIEQIYRTKI